MYATASGAEFASSRIIMTQQASRSRNEARSQVVESSGRAIERALCSGTDKLRSSPVPPQMLSHPGSFPHLQACVGVRYTGWAGICLLHSQHGATSDNLSACPRYAPRRGWKALCGGHHTSHRTPMSFGREPRPVEPALFPHLSDIQQTYTQETRRAMQESRSIQCPLGPV